MFAITLPVKYFSSRISNLHYAWPVLGESITMVLFIMRKAKKRDSEEEEMNEWGNQMVEAFCHLLKDCGVVLLRTKRKSSYKFLLIGHLDYSRHKLVCAVDEETYQLRDLFVWNMLFNFSDLRVETQCQKSKRKARLCTLNTIRNILGALNTLTFMRHPKFNKT